MTEQINSDKNIGYYVDKFFTLLGDINDICEASHIYIESSMAEIANEYTKDSLIPGYSKEGRPFDVLELNLIANILNSRWRIIIDRIAKVLYDINPKLTAGILENYSKFIARYNSFLQGVRLEERGSIIKISILPGSNAWLLCEYFHMAYIYNNYKHLYLTPTEVEVPEDPNPQDPMPEVPETQEPTDPEPTDPIPENPDDTTTEPNTTEDNQG